LVFISSNLDILGKFAAESENSPFDQWRSQLENLGGAKIGGSKMFDFRRITLFYLEKRLSKHKITIYSKNLGGPWPLWPPLATLMP